MEAKTNPTKSEAAVWEGLRNGQLGVPFVQQEIIGKYRVDFYCDKAMLSWSWMGVVIGSRGGWPMTKNATLG
jgi:hypothetical protein